VFDQAPRNTPDQAQFGELRGDPLHDSLDLCVEVAHDLSADGSLAARITLSTVTAVRR
jgi:hypothetical protein